MRDRHKLWAKAFRCTSRRKKERTEVNTQREVRSHHAQPEMHSIPSRVVLVNLREQGDRNARTGRGGRPGSKGAQGHHETGGAGDGKVEGDGILLAVLISASECLARAYRLCTACSPTRLPHLVIRWARRVGGHGLGFGLCA